MNKNAEALKKGDALLIIDVQNDFCPGGALPIDEGDRVVPVLNQWIDVARKKGVPVYASRDIHPLRHVSFREQGGQWPPHCIEDSAGAALHPDLDLPADTVKITKGVRMDKDQNSAFDETGLASELRREGIQRLWVGGLALDVCVLATVIHARIECFDVFVLEKATRPVSPVRGEAAIRKMKAAGAHIID
ncbi:MAG: isochorismatase family protein [Nitrospiraceae bacterium]|nr:MAG: isochorismatase family protein [Nitrospiraceae bacterium]